MRVLEVRSAMTAITRTVVGVLDRRVSLLRLARSSWMDPALADRDRPLAGRGGGAARAMRRDLREQKVEPDVVVCSTAERARQMLEGGEPAVGRGAVGVERELDGAGPTDLLTRLHEIAPSVRSVMVIGDNPGLEELAPPLASDGSKRRHLEEKLPTGALATLALQGPWAGLEPGTAELIGFVWPRDLESWR
jgi:phosphohistidine phosphatase